MIILIHRMSEEDHDRFLKHHGILGQKWYDRNGPPYPLNPAKDYSAKEKKLNKYSKSVDDFKETYKINNRKKYSRYDIHKLGYLGCSYDGYKFEDDLNYKTGFVYPKRSKIFKKEFKELNEKQNKIKQEWDLLEKKRIN